MQFVAALGMFLVNTANRAHVNESDLTRTVFIDDLAVAATDFDASAEVIDKLIASGRDATANFFDEIWNEPSPSA